MSVLVTNAKNRIAYNIVKSLGKKGITVHTADFVSPAMAGYSKYSKSYFQYPSPYSREKEFIESLIVNIERLGVEVLIPVFEESFLISKYKDRLGKHVKLVVSDYEKVLTLHNKDRWQPIAANMGISVPMSYSATKLKNGEIDINTLRFPVLVKPKQGGGAWAILQLNSATELKGLLQNNSYLDLEWGRFFIQEKIEGDVNCVAMLFRHGEYRACATYKQVRDFPATGGQATLRISLRQKKAENDLKMLLEKMKWHGVCHADFVVDKTTQIPYLIDINPRFWGSLVQAIASGVDFPYLFYKLASDGDVDTFYDFQIGVKTRWIGGDLRGFAQNLRKSERKLSFLKEFFFEKHQMYDDFSINDPVPFFIWWFDAIKKVVQRRTLKPTAHESLEGVWE